MAADEYGAWQETAYLFRAPANARRLLDAAEAAKRGETVERPARSGVRLVFTPQGWEDYTYWTDRALVTRINRLLDDATRDPTSGIGKPEPLKYGIVGGWSRRITEEHRLVYQIPDEDLIVLQTRYHYAQ